MLTLPWLGRLSGNPTGSKGHRAMEVLDNMEKTQPLLASRWKRTEPWNTWSLWELQRQRNGMFPIGSPRHVSLPILTSVLSDLLWTSDLQSSVLITLYLFSCCCDQISDTKRLNKDVFIWAYGYRKSSSIGAGKARWQGPEAAALMSAVRRQGGDRKEASLLKLKS